MKKISKKFVLLLTLALVVGALTYAYNSRIYCKVYDCSRPGDVRLRGTMRYFDVVVVGAKISNPAYRYKDGDDRAGNPVSDDSVIPSNVKFTDKDFERLGLKIIEEEFYKKFGDTHVIFAADNGVYTFETHPLMVRIDLSLQKRRNGKSYVELAYTRTYWGMNFPIAYGGAGSNEMKANFQDYKNLPDTLRHKAKEGYLQLETFPTVGAADDGFIPEHSQDLFISQVEQSIRNGLKFHIKGAKPESEIAREYSMIFLNGLK